MGRFAVYLRRATFGTGAVGSLQRWLLERELSSWTEAGRRPRLWWRDDAARGVTPALLQLLDVADGFPLALTIAPHRDLAPLAREVSSRRHVSFGQYGFELANGETPASVEAMAAAIKVARQCLVDAGTQPSFYVPPSGRVDDKLRAALHDARFTAVSAWGKSSAYSGGVGRVDAHIDLLVGESPRARFCGRGRFLTALTAQLRRRRKGQLWGEAVGLLTHHADHDDAAWRFLSDFLTFARGRFEWRRADDLIPRSSEHD